MNKSDLSRVNRLSESLESLLAHHRMLKNLINGSPYRDSKIPHEVRITIGGSGGNGTYKTVTTAIHDVEYVVRLIDKEASDCWGKIVGIRMKLRELGVNLDE